MNPEQALQIIKSLMNLSLLRGGIYQTVEESDSVSTAFKVLQSLVISVNNAKIAQKTPPVENKGIETGN